MKSQNVCWYTYIFFFFRVAFLYSIEDVLGIPDIQESECVEMPEAGEQILSDMWSSDSFISSFRFLMILPRLFTFHTPSLTISLIILTVVIPMMKFSVPFTFHIQSPIKFLTLFFSSSRQLVMI